MLWHEATQTEYKWLRDTNVYMCTRLASIYNQHGAALDGMASQLSFTSLRPEAYNSPRSLLAAFDSERLYLEALPVTSFAIRGLRRIVGLFGILEFPG
jgi:hypothetical protein